MSSFLLSEFRVSWILGFGCWFRVSFGPVPGFVWSRIPGFVDSGFRVLVPGFARASYGFRVDRNSGFRLKKFLGSTFDPLD